jgi:hypothetical protein
VLSIIDHYMGRIFSKNVYGHLEIFKQHRDDSIKVRRERETEIGLLSLKKSQNNNKAKIKKWFVSRTRPTV